MAGSGNGTSSHGLPGLSRRPAFVVSMGCSGAPLLARALRMHSDLLSIDEFFGALGSRILDGGRLPASAFWERLMKFDPPLEELMRTGALAELSAARGEGAAQLSPLEAVALARLTSTPSALLANLRAHLLERPESLPCEHSDALFGFLLRASGRPRWVECSEGSVEYLGELLAHWPKAKLIYLVRDGRDVACDMAAHPIFRLRMARLLSGEPTLPVKACMEASIPLHQFAAFWSAAMLRAEVVLRERTSADLHLLRYELLVHASSLELDRVAHFLTGERAPPGWLTRCAKIVRHAPSRWCALPESERSELEAACRPGMECLQRLATRY